MTLAPVQGIEPFKPVRPVATETVKYRGYEIEVCNRDLLIFAPNGDVACFYSMMRARKWINRHRRENP